MKKNKLGIIIVLMSVLAFSCKTEKKEGVTTAEIAEEKVVEEVTITYDTNNPKSIIKAVEAASGGWGKLWKQHDVEFNYTYIYPDGKADKSVERYIFDTEQSWGKYTQHDVNVMPGIEGGVIQYYDGVNAHISHKGKKMEDPALVGGTEFLRKANYFWFVMMFKLDNPGVVYEYQGKEDLNGIAYEKVLVTYDPAITKKEQNDTYILFVNPETKLVDQFYFSLPAFGFNDPALLMKVGYEEINGLMIPSKRDIFFPNEKGEYGSEPSLKEISTNIKFNNGFKDADLSI